MFILRVENSSGSILNLTHNEENFQVLSVDGLNPPNSKINTTEIAGMDGVLFNSSKLESRNIVITLKIKGDIETNRLLLYKFFRIKEKCKLYLKNKSRNVFIEGYVENNECNLFTNDERMQISIICPDPYFKDLEMLTDDISKVVSKFKFPFSINLDNPIPFSEIEFSKNTNVINKSESKVGLIIYANFVGKVNKLEIRNIKTGEILTIEYNFIEKDYLIINCNKGSKRIILQRNGEEYNLIANLKVGSTFLQLDVGDNNFSYLADEGETDNLVFIKFSRYNIYGGF